MPVPNVGEVEGAWPPFTIKSLVGTYIRLTRILGATETWWAALFRVVRWVAVARALNGNFPIPIGWIGPAGPPTLIALLAAVLATLLVPPPLPS